MIIYRTIEPTSRVPVQDSRQHVVQASQQQQLQQRHQQQQLQRYQQLQLQRHQQQGAMANEGQLLITDPTRLMPVQITIPAQAGHPNSVPKALTVQVHG